MGKHATRIPKPERREQPEVRDRPKNVDGLIWDWTTDTWTWTPDMGRYSAVHGRPKGCVFLEVSTGALPPEECYNYWRETVFYHFGADPDNPEGTKGFRAHAHGLIAPRGEPFVSRSDAITGRRTEKQIQEDGRDVVDVGLVLAGSRHHEPENDTPYTGRRGDVFVYDSARPSRVAWSDHQVVYLRLARETVQTALGGNVPAASVLVRALTRSSLWPFLRAQMALLARRLPSLSRAERAMLLDHTIDLALATLQAVGLKEHQRHEPTRHGLFLAAQRFIDRHLSDPDLSIETVAGAVGCSRATLYRAFAENNLTVAGYIREQRLQRFHRLLRTVGKEVPLAVLAEQCGLWDVSNVSKVFRRRFGITPSEARSGSDPKPPESSSLL